jgi:hypothetical protein
MSFLCLSCALKPPLLPINFPLSKGGIYYFSEINGAAE